MLKDIVKAKRKELGLTILQLAIRSDLTPQTISNVEAGKAFTLGTSKKLAGALELEHVPVD